MDRAGQDIDGTEADKAVCKAGLERTFSERYLLRTNLANLHLSEGKRNEAFMLGVLYPYVWKQLLAPLHDLYNTQWRGLAELLILREGNARACTRDK